MLDKKKLMIINIILSIFMIAGIILLVYTFIYDKSLKNSIHNTSNIESFGEKEIKMPVVWSLYATSIADIICVVIINIMLAIFGRQSYDNKKIWKIQLMGGLVIINAILTTKNYLDNKRGKDV